MVHYVETLTKNGQTIRIEVDEAARAGAGFARQSPSPDVSSDASKEAYTQMLDAVRGCADGVIDVLQNLEAQPSSASVDFAIKVDAEAGALIAKSREGAHFRISLSWKQPDAEEKD
ncbi:MAG TPA: CU044_2847 family protein [Anaerolineae bacterium]|nr:hypothetical protein [Anaerolineae bacterium]MCB0181395.1 hypothetical protein [Anaerolineae bacterium]MCB0222883.1 hypothetical protein [Anaerolineae bacterium]MCB9103421.1 hypothetical protein [Anaerolineales bacterium]HRV92884.1 CU044_2847 family protein [Anaerolineae bacterium]